MDLFPYKPRKNQKEIMQTIKNTLITKNNLILESTTGSGKTVCVLTSTLEFALQNNKKIIYTTRTNAQQKQVIVELREIRKYIKKNKEQIFGIGIQGRSNTCMLARTNPEFSKGTSEELAKLCSNEKKKVRSKNKGKDKGCIYYRNLLKNNDQVEKTLEWTRNHIPTVEEFTDYCQKKRLCPYEINKLLVQEAQVVVVPYVYVFDPDIRVRLLDWLSISEDDIILIVDEAHNLPNYIRDLFSMQLSMWMLKSCVFEAEKFGNPPLLDGKVLVSEFCKQLMDIISDLRNKYIYNVSKRNLGMRISSDKNDAFIPPSEFQTELMSKLNITSKKLSTIISDLVAYGEKIQEYKEKDGKLPRSYLRKLGLFLDFWMNLELDQYIKLIVDSVDGQNPRLEAFCLDPSVGTSIINDFHASVHMSGTLEPLEEYRDSIGLSENTVLTAFPSPFLRDNRKVLFVGDVTTKYDDLNRDSKMINKIRNHISNVCNTFHKNTMVFFPSFAVLSMFLKNDLHEDIEKKVYMEEQGMSQSELMKVVESFKDSANQKKSNGSTLLSVIGGRISEGMDFPAEQLEIAIIVGIPYPKPTARQRGLQQYYELKFGKGWEYTVNAPTARKLLQSIGRLIRDEDDRGIAIILDKRAPRFKQYINDMTESKNLMEDIQDFMFT